METREKKPLVICRQALYNGAGREPIPARTYAGRMRPARSAKGGTNVKRKRLLLEKELEE